MSIKKAAKAAIAKLCADKIRKIAVRAKLRVLAFLEITLAVETSVIV